MEVERQRYASDVVGKDEKGRAIVGPEHKVGGVEKFEFGMQSDVMSQVIGGGYQQLWNPDFLQRKLGKEGTCARYYFDRRVAVDIADPDSEMSTRKRKLLFRHGFGYLCIPTGYSKERGKLASLYSAALEEYRNYENLHPRPSVVQETVITDEKGRIRRALMTAIDIQVGGGLIGSREEQEKELKKSSVLSTTELQSLKSNAKLHRKLRKAVQSGTPFRNPFIAPGKRRYNLAYAS